MFAWRCVPGVRVIPRLALRLMPLVLLLAIALHQGSMATFALAYGAGESVVGVPVVEGRHNDCPGHPARSRMCGAAKPFVQRLSPSLVLLALLAAFATPAPRRPAMRSRGASWIGKWPPNKRRALSRVCLR